MLPMESAAIIRGLLRVQNITDAMEVLHDELSLPLEVSLRLGFECEIYNGMTIVSSQPCYL